MTMSRTTVLKGFTLVALVVSTTGCGMHVSQAYNEFKSQKYLIPISSEESNSPSLIVHVNHVKWRGVEKPFWPDDFQAHIIRTSIKNFATYLKPGLSSIEDVPQAAQYADFGLSFDIRPKVGNVAVDAAGAFVKGFFTLGSLPETITYTSHATLDAVRWDGRTTTISVKSDTIKVEYDPRETGSRERAAGITQAYDNSMQKIATQLIREGFFQ